MIDILTKYATGEYSLNYFAKKYSITAQTIGHIIHGRNWQNIDRSFLKENILVKEQVIEIIDLFKTKQFTLEELGKKFGVNGITIRDIVSGKTWKEMGISLNFLTFWKSQPRGEDHKRVKLKEQEVLEVMDLLKANILTIEQIASKYSVYISIIYNINSGKTWGHLTNLKQGAQIRVMRNKKNKGISK